jgi:hypothetical protein
VYVESSLMIERSNISDSYTSVWQDNGGCPSWPFTQGGYGGAFAVAKPVDLELKDVSIRDITTDYGGVLGIGQLTNLTRLNIADLFPSSLLATKAGGLLFVLQSNASMSALNQVCSEDYGNKTRAIFYGNVCASSPKVLSFRFPPASAVAPGQQTQIHLTLSDAFNSTVVDSDASVAVTLLYSFPDDSLVLRSGAVRDAAHSGSDGIFRFDTFSLEGRENAAAAVRFFSDATFIQPGAPSIVDTVMKTTSCLPSYFSASENATEVLCVICPAQSYLMASRDCQVCPERHVHAAGHHETEEYSCVNAPEVQEQAIDHEDSQRNRMSWKISAGYYPVPSLERPEEVLACPNGACRPFECEVHHLSDSPRFFALRFVHLQAYVSVNRSWALNCSSCPTSAHADGNNHVLHDATPWTEDCHCEHGYKDRLCSRCSCNETVCYFSAGESQYRHCALCRQPSTIVIVVAVVALQVSLVVFLLFKRSAIALLLAELAITVVLFIVGIGEAWMLDLFIMLGLLFVITSLSQRLPRQKHVKSPLDETTDDDSQLESDVEQSHDLGHNEHHHHNHKVAAKTAAIAKITIFFLQSAASIVKPAAWPKWISAVVSQLDALNLRVSGIECFAPSILSNPVAKLALQLALPLIVGVNIMIAAIIAAILLRLDPVGKIKALIRSCRTKPTANHRVSYDSGEPEESLSRSLFFEGPSEHESLLDSQPNAATVTVGRPWKLGDLVSRVQFSCFFLLSASYFELTNVILEVLRPCSKGHMANFPWIACEFSNSYYAGLMAIALCCMFLYTIGIPVFFGAIMLCNRRRILAGDPSMENRFGFLFESYRYACRIREPDF